MEKLITLTTDRTGQEIKIKYVNAIGTGPQKLIQLFFKNYADLIENGHGRSWMTIHNLCPAVYVEADDKIVGHIIFDVIHDREVAWIVMSGVDPQYRRRGLYKIMHHEFEKLAKELGCNHIESFVHVTNTTRLATAKSVGYEPEFYKMYKKI